MLPMPSELSTLDYRASHLLYHIRKHLQRDGIRGATEQTIVLRVHSYGFPAKWFRPLLEDPDTCASVVKESNRSMYCTGWRINSAQVKHVTPKGWLSELPYLHLSLDFDAARMTGEAKQEHEREERRRAIEALEAQLAELTAKIGELVAA